MPNSPKQPTGTVTFLFTDIVGSTEMWEQHGDAFMPVLQAHNAIVMDAVQRYGGFVMKFEGDAYKAAFQSPSDAMKCAILAQAALQRYPWPGDVGPLRVRMALHTGTPFAQGKDYFGPPVNRTARILSTSHGGQIMMSEETMKLVSSRADVGTSLVDQGYHQLRDLDEPLRLFQVEHPALAERSFPPPKSMNGHANNLPVQRTSFIGREREIDQIAALLSRDDTPLLTLTGPGGIGKTRLSLQAAAERIEWFPDGVWHVRLDNVHDADAAAKTLATTLGIPLDHDQTAIETVRTFLVDRQCLLILDDCGNIPEAGRFIRELLSGSTSLRCLATSRESLHLDTGAVLPVPELSLPDENAGAEELLASESGRLFVERAHAARPDFAVTDARAKPISRLLRAMGGVADSIEKAAGLIKSRNAGQILTALGKDVAQGMGEVRDVAVEQGKELADRARDSGGLAALLQSLSTVAADRNLPAAAEASCKEALAIYERLGDRDGVARSLHQLGNIAVAQGDAGRAVSLLGAAHQLYIEIGSSESIKVRADLEEARSAHGEAHRGSSFGVEQVIADAIGRGR